MYFFRAMTFLLCGSLLGGSAAALHAGTYINFGDHPNYNAQLPLVSANLMEEPLPLEREFPQYNYAINGNLIGYFDPLNPGIAVIWTLLPLKTQEAQGESATVPELESASSAGRSGDVFGGPPAEEPLMQETANLTGPPQNSGIAGELTGAPEAEPEGPGTDAPSEGSPLAHRLEPEPVAVVPTPEPATTTPVLLVLGALLAASSHHKRKRN